MSGSRRLFWRRLMIARFLLVSLVVCAACTCSPPAESVAESKDLADATPGGTPAESSLAAEEFTAKELAEAAAAVGDEPLASAQPSLPALGQSVVQALGSTDKAALAGLLITKDDYFDRLWRALANHPSALRMGPRLLWVTLDGESRGDLQGALMRYGGRDFEFVDIRPIDRIERPGGVVLHIDPVIEVKDAAGKTETLEVLGPVVEHAKTKTFKLLSFRDSR